MRRIAYTILLVTILYGCEKAYVQPGEVPETVSFSTDIIPIFSTSCANCHASGSIFPGLILTTDVAYDQLLTDGINTPYVVPSDPASSSLYVRMTTDMPPSGLVSVTKQEIILKWIEEGAENN
tara:strand:+ start:214 stop:582 length:369 start_codon:yes stop_codon:yes gene_type:complete